jgi:Na+-driven multidrug efflux pump
MRVQKLLGKGDGQGARQSLAVLTMASFLLVALTNVPILLFTRFIAEAVSNQPKVQDWFQQMCWVLALHSQLRILAVSTGCMFVPVGRGWTSTAANVVCFYLIACPLAAVVDLTSLVTDSVAVKIVVNCGASSVGMGFGALFNVVYLYTADWSKLADLVHARANNDSNVEGDHDLMQSVPQD